MVVVTKRDLIATVAERWRATHFGRGYWVTATDSFDPEQIYLALKALPPEASEAQVTAITGQPWWTQNFCAECENDSAVTVGFGAELHHPTDTCFICLDCLERGLLCGRQ